MTPTEALLYGFLAAFGAILGIIAGRAFHLLIKGLWRLCTGHAPPRQEPHWTDPIISEGGG